MATEGRVVVIGGGITGASVAYHLARAGWRDVLVLEKGELTSGSTHHAAGLVTQFNPSATMMGFRRYSVSLYSELGVFNAVGSVRIASSADSLADLRRAVSRAAALGLEAELIGPRRGARAAAVRLARIAPRRRLDGRRRPRRSAHHHLRGRRRCARARRPDPDPDARDRNRARARPRGAGGADRGASGSRPSTSSTPPGMWAPGARRDGRRAAAVGAGRPSARPDAGGPGRRGAARRARASATPTTSSTARTRPAGC